MRKVKENKSGIGYIRVGTFFRAYNGYTFIEKLQNIINFFKFSCSYVSEQNMNYG